MRRRHFEELRPVCPVCAGNAGESHSLHLAGVSREEGDCIVEGVLHCPSARCRREYPIIDGIPLLISNLRSYVSENIHHIAWRDDLSEVNESLLGDCCGPGSALDLTRQQLSTYGWGHYGDLDAHCRGPETTAGSIVRVLERSLELSGAWPDGPALDVGCSVGRAAFELARRNRRLVLGVDMSFAMLRVAQGVLRRGEVRYPLRRTGLVYERREYAADFPEANLVDFWACDATALPFPPGMYSLAASLNVLDCVPSPRDHLASVARVVRPGGVACFSAPYDWSPGATPLEAWVGGHSQRGEGGGRSEPLLRALLTPDAHPLSIGGLRIIGEEEHFQWTVRLHDRSSVSYDAHLVVARAEGAAEGADG